MKQKYEGSGNSLMSWLRKNWLIVGVCLVLFYLVAVKVVAIHELPLIADEPDDISLTAVDLKNIGDFSEPVISADQARLPNVLAAPFVAIFKQEVGTILRYQSLIFHIVFLIGFLQLLRLKLSDLQAFYGFVLIALSSYLFSFSFLAMSTSNSLYLMITVWLFYYYLKFIAPNPNKQTVKVTTFFGAFIGIMLASKLLGLLVMVAIFIYDTWISRKQKPFFNSKKLLDYPQQWTNLLFIVAWLVINLLSLGNQTTLILMFALVVAYLLISVSNYYNQNNKEIVTGFIARWIYITQTAFAVTLIASPAYLNLKSFIAIFGWNEQWNNDFNTIEPTKWDAYIIIGVKYGIVVGFGLLIALIILWRQRRLKTLISDNGLLLSVAVTHLLAFLYIKNIITWYPLIFFPLLYLPFCYLFPNDFSSLKRSVKTLTGASLIILLLAIPVFEQWRYLRIFPYGHTEGAQLGTRFVGWNRPGIVTFEAVALVIDDLKSQPDRFPGGLVRCAAVDLKGPIGQSYATQYINYNLVKNGLGNFKCTPSWDGDDSKSAPYMVTSPYSDKELVESAPKYYTKIRDYEVNGVIAGTFWQKR